MTKKRMESIAQLVCKAGMDVEVVEVNKINGTRLGLVLKGVEVAPTLYLDSVEDESDEVAVEFVLRAMEACKDPDLDIFDLLRDENVIGFVVNREQNQKLLENIPHMDICDLAIGFRFTKNCQSCVISNNLMNQLGYTLEQLYSLACQNATPQIASMQNLLAELGYEYMLGDMPVPMYVITNENRYFGAFEAFLIDNLESVSSYINSDLIVIPSSIHECIVVPMDICEMDYVREMVRDVNQTVVCANEILSNNIYIYSRETGELKIS